MSKENIANHQQLLEAIGLAQNEAAKLTASGAKIPNILRGLKDAASELENRLKYLQRARSTAPKPASSFKSAKERKVQAAKQAEQKTKAPLTPLGSKPAEEKQTPESKSDAPPT